MPPTETTAPRLMPPRWFYGETMHWIMSGVLTDHSEHTRILASGERHLGAFIVPAFQRKPVWSLFQKTRLIESIYMGLPIGAIVYNQTPCAGPTDRWLLDGQQRVTALVEYVEGEWPVSGWRYTDLPLVERRHFERMGVAVIETRLTEETDCRDVYERLAYGGTDHIRRETSDAQF